MGALRQLLIVGPAALAALLLVASAMAGVAALDSATNSNALLRPSFAAKTTFGYTLILGILPALLIGVPGYLLLLRRRAARWYYALGLGVVPGIVALPLDANLGAWAVVCGGAVAMLTHLACRRLVPNNSFKPNPLRGSA
jgi:hypothetical protein